MKEKLIKDGKMPKRASRQQMMTRYRTLTSSRTRQRPSLVPSPSLR